MLAGEFRVGRPYGDGCDYISVEIVDESSGIQFLEARVKYADFALALTSLGVPCEYCLRGTENVGKVRETKYEEVFVPRSDSWGREERETAAMAAVKALEGDGWSGYTQDALNFHKQIRREEGGSVYRVLYTRLV